MGKSWRKLWIFAKIYFLDVLLLEEKESNDCVIHLKMITFRS